MHDIIIHGATSFLGKHFIRKLISEKTPFTIFARESSKISFDVPGIKIHRYKNVISEINSSEMKFNSPVFFEFSWQGVFGSERNKEEQLSVNLPLITSSVNVAHALGSSHWIGIGSQAEYGNLDKRITETDDCFPTTLYGKSKLECAFVSAELCRKYGMEHSWLRLFSVYGPDDNHEWLIQYLIKEMLSGKEVNVTLGEQKWDYLYIDDISRMFFKLRDAKGVGIANLGSGNAVKVRTIIEKIKLLTNSKSKINFGAIPYRDDQVMLMEADITKLSSHLDWKPVTSLDEGLKKTIDSIVKEGATINQ